jgi:hypothetical protein
VKAFEPYDQVKEENPEARTAGRQLITEGQAAGAKAPDVRFREQSLGRKCSGNDCRYGSTDLKTCQPEIRCSRSASVLPDDILRVFIIAQ